LRYNHNSKYCYPNTNVLINKLNIRDEEQLEKAELRITALRMYQLETTHPLAEETWDLNYLKAIHGYIFQDIYAFAGEIREEQIAKGGFQFASPLYIEEQAKELFNQLKAEHYLKGQNKDKIIHRLAYYYSEINVLHPFREGNGRTQRTFLHSLAAHNAYKLDWSLANKDTLLKASIESTHNLTPITEIIHMCLSEKELHIDFEDDGLELE